MRRTNIMIMVFILLFFVIEPVVQARSSEEEQLLPLSSLKPGCVLKMRWIGLIPDFAEGVWLWCGSVAFLVRNPLNLVNHVELKTPDEALEYVRFFSTFPSCDYFDLDKMVEVLPKHDKGELGLFELYEPIFLKHFRPASAKEILYYGPDRDEGCCRGRQFHVTRTVLMSDGTIYEVEEYVCDDGFYWIQSKKALMKVKCAWRFLLSACIN